MQNLTPHPNGRQARRLAMLLLAVCSPAVAEMPKANYVSPLAIAPGQSTTIAVHGLNLKDATHLWTEKAFGGRRLLPVANPVVKSAFEAGARLPKGTIIREAESFLRGKIQKQGSFVSNGGFTPNYVEWDFDLLEPSRFVLELKYASGDSRPMRLSVNGQLLNNKAARGVTGGFGEDDAKWMAEGVVALRKGLNTIRLERSGDLPHIDKLALVPTKLPATQWMFIQPTDTIAPFEIMAYTNTVGIYPLRIVTRTGISNPLFYMVATLQIVGFGVSADGQLRPPSSIASTRNALRKTLPRILNPPASLDETIAVGIVTPVPHFFGMSVDGTGVMFPRLVGKTYFTVRVSNRAKGFHDPVKIRIKDLPRGFRVSGGELPVRNSQNNEYRFLLRGPKNTEVGIKRFRVEGAGMFKGQARDVTLFKVHPRLRDCLCRWRSIRRLTPRTDSSTRIFPSAAGMPSSGCSSA